MNKYLFMAGVAALSLGACTNDQTVDLNETLKQSDEIRFDVRAENNTRAASVYCNWNMPNPTTNADGINLYAVSGGNHYFTEKLYKSGGNWTIDSKRYWPASATFYAVYNGEAQSTWSDYSEAPKVDFIVEKEVANHKDLLYATAEYSTRPDNNKVELNLRHALSQVVFKAKNTNKNLYVEIKGVKIVNLHKEGTYELPAKTTETNIVDHTQGDYTTTVTRGKWGETFTTDYDPEVAFTTAVALTGSKSATAVNLTDFTDAQNPATAIDYSKAMLLLPETTTPWNPAAATPATRADEEATKASGTYFAVKCKIWNVADATKGKQANDVVLWADESDNAKEIWIPASFTWEQGKKYTYTFVFGDGDGGYTPDPDDPQPVLVAVSFDCKVDDFIKGEEKNVQMEGNK